MAVSGKQIEAREPFYGSSDTAKPDESNYVAPKRPYTDSIKAELPRGADVVDTERGLITVEAPELPHSQFNNFNLLRVKSVGDFNYPLTDEDSAEHSDLYQNVTARQLIENPRGASIYRAEDFLYAEKYGVIPNNRMITLRRFPYPVFDDIFGNIQQLQLLPDVTRMIGFADQETNKLSELLSFSLGLKWRDLKSDFEQSSMLGDNQEGINGWMRNVMKYVDPTFAQNQLDIKRLHGFNPLHDSNKTYGPVDSITEMQIRDRGLNFKQEIDIKFEYRMKSINGINQKAAFLDLLSNIFLMTTNDAKFWGGARYWVGARPTKYLQNLQFLTPTDHNDFVNGATKEFKTFIGKVTGPGGAKNALKVLQQVAENAMNMQLGKLLDKLGRPGIPIMNSLLTGTPTGEWHLTIGNPMNPIMCIGDMIMDTATVTLGDELGYDDFPTTIIVDVKLSHNKPKGRAEIESMFNAGKGRIYFKPEKPFAVETASAKSTAHEPALVSDLINTGLNAVTGKFDKEALLRTGQQFWSFAKI
jgi:hypothetical protein